MAISKELKALLFDLDDTLVATKQIRDAWDADQTLQFAARCRMRRADAICGVLAKLDGKIKLGVVTRSREDYASAVLERVFPDIDFDVIVCNTTQIRTKPYPDPLLEAAKPLGVKPGQIAYFGDQKADIEAAYHARMRHVLCTWANRDHGALRMVPDAVLTQPSQILDYVADPDSFLPAVEQELAGSTEVVRERSIVVFPNGTMLKAHVLGRYYSNEGVTLALHDSHELSLQISKKKLSKPFPIPDAWPTALARVINHHSPSGLDIITAIPAKPGRDNRLERILEAIDDTGEVDDAVIDDSVLAFSDDAKQIKHSSVAERIAAVESTISVKAKVKGKSILLLDDVLTTGASLSAATARLIEAGATKVTVVAVAKAIGGASFEVTPGETRTCPNCGRPMVIRPNRTTNERFWGCRGFPGCRHTEPL